MSFAASYRTFGGLVAVGASLMVSGILLHARPDPALEQMMITIAEGATRWRLSHGLLLFGAIFLAIGSLLITVGRTRLTDRRRTLMAWAGVVIALPIFGSVIVAATRFNGLIA